MNEKPRKWWLVIALILSLWLCMIFAVSSVVFVNSADDPLYRREGCFSYSLGVWYYRDATGEFHPDYHNMSQKDRRALSYVCIQLT